MSPGTDRKYWFAAKKYGWGWGPPNTWQGWAVLGVYLALLLGGIPLVQVTRGSLVFFLYLTALTLLLTVICWLKGEPPRWRWGDRDA